MLVHKETILDEIAEQNQGLDLQDLLQGYERPIGAGWQEFAVTAAAGVMIGTGAYPLT